MVLLQHTLLIHGPHKLQKIGTCTLLSHTQNKLQLKANHNRHHRVLNSKDKPLNNNSSQHMVNNSEGKDKVASNLNPRAITQILMLNKLRRPNISNVDATHMASKSVMSTRKDT